MKLSFRRFLESGELCPFVFGMTRDKIIRLLGTPSSWSSEDEGIGPPRRHYSLSDAISFGSLTFSFRGDRVIRMSVVADIMRDYEWTYPVEVISFPKHGTLIGEIVDYMRNLEIPFRDCSAEGDCSDLITAGGVELVAWPGGKGRLAFCYSEVSKQNRPNQALEPTNPAVTPCAPSSTSRASRVRGSS